MLKGVELMLTRMELLLLSREMKTNLLKNLLAKEEVNKEWNRMEILHTNLVSRINSKLKLQVTPMSRTIEE